MNPVDHPHGGGEGRTSGGRHPVSPWGVPTKGKKTRGKKAKRQIHCASSSEASKGPFWHDLFGRAHLWMAIY